MNIRRTLPLRSLAVFNSSALTSSVNSILLPPRILFLEHYTTPGQFSFRKSLRHIVRKRYKSMTKSAAIYCRVSTEKQKGKEASLKTQKEGSLELCKSQGYTVEPHHIYVDAYTGTE